MVTGMATVMAMAMVQMVLERVDGPVRRVLPSASDRRPGKEVRNGGRGGQTSASLFAVALICVALPARAQVGEIAPALDAGQTPTAANPTTDAGAGGGIAANARAPKWQIQPTIAINETLTNNVFLTSTNPTGDLVSSITPGISIDGKGARASLRLNYSITENLYARESASNNHQNALTAIGTLQAIEDWLFIDATGTISQQYLSPFGKVSPSSASVNNNQTETSNYSISPYVKGRFLSSTEYLLRYKVATTSSQSDLASDLTTSQWIGRVNGLTRLSALTWSLDASNVSSDYQLGRDTEDTRYGASLSYRFNPEIQVTLIAGQESNNYVSLQQETHSDSGFGVLWTPGPRTKFEATATRRFFGNGYQVGFSHRMPLSLLTYTASRNVTFQPSGVSNTGQGSNYDAYYAIIAANNPGLPPDAISAQVNQVLQSRGVPANGAALSDYLSNRPNLQSLQNLSFALLGARNTVTLTATENEQQPLTVASGVTNDFSTSVRTLQRGVALVWGHQLTGFSSLSLSINQQRTIGFTPNSPDTKTEGAYLLFTSRLTPNTNANMTARRVIASGVTGYTESALTGGLSYRF